MDENALPQFSNVTPTDVLQARIAAEDVSTDPGILRKLALKSDKATREADTEALAFSPDGKLLASGDRSTIRLWKFNRTH